MVSRTYFGSSDEAYWYLLCRCTQLWRSVRSILGQRYMFWMLVGVCLLFSLCLMQRIGQASGKTSKSNTLRCVRWNSILLFIGLASYDLLIVSLIFLFICFSAMCSLLSVTKPFHNPVAVRLFGRKLIWATNKESKHTLLYFSREMVLSSCFWDLDLSWKGSKWI